MTLHAELAREASGASRSSELSKSRRALVGSSLFLLSLICVQIGWLLAVPPGYGIDEFDHAYRASSVASGYWSPGSTQPEDGRGVLIPVADDIARAAFEPCDNLDYTGPDNCTPVTARDADGMVLIASAAGTYNPLWYYVVGTAALPFQGADAIVAMRVASVILCDLMLFLAAWLTIRGARSAWPLIGLSAVCAPVLVYATAIAAPNGLEYSGGVLMWAALLVMIRRGHHPIPRSYWWLLGVSASVVATVHATGPLWVGAVALLTLPLTGGVLRSTWRFQRSALLVTLAAIMASCVASAGWILWDSNALPPDKQAYGPIPLGEVVRAPVLWALQSLATLRFRGDAAPLGVYAACGALIATLILFGLWRASTSVRAVMAMLVLTSALVPMLLTTLSYDDIGMAWQGRYSLPLTVGITMLAASQIDKRPTPGRWLLWLPAVAVGFAHTAAVRGMFAEELPDVLSPPLVAYVILGLGVTIMMGIAFRISNDPTRARSQTTTTEAAESIT